MRILVDGDACPDKMEIYLLAEKYHVEMIVYMDYAHVCYGEDYQVKYCEVGKDSVDMMIVHDVLANDIVITQDYGLSSLLLTKSVKVLHVNGEIIDRSNIQELLMQRYIGVKNRKRNKHIKGPKKRTSQQSHYLLQQLELLLRGII